MGDDWHEAVLVHTRQHSPHTRLALLGYARCIARHLAAAGDGDVARAVAGAVTEKTASCPRALPQVVRRLHTTANLVWFRLLGRLPQALPLPGREAPMRYGDPFETDAATRVFSEDEVRALLAAAAQHSPAAHVLLCVLFTTGLRIGAAAAMTWRQVLTPTGDGIASVAVVREKGNARRVVLLNDVTRRALWTLRSCATPRDACATPRVLSRSVRQLRNIFYTVCRKAGLQGAHCHPHTARHTLAHHLFALGNSVALIAKFLGHRSLQTTNTHYLRLGFEEVLGRMRLPWMQPSPA
jgi:integrase